MKVLTFARALLGVGVLALAAPSPARAAPSRWEKLDRELATVVNDPALPLASLSVLAIRDGKVAYEKQFGRRHIALAADESDLPATPETLYRVASISKLVTTLGVMRLVEDGKLSLDADLSELLGFRLRNPHFPDAPITLRMLLTHTSSLRDGGGYFLDPAKALKDMLTPDGSSYGEGAMWGKEAAPGQFFSYANLPWCVVAQAVERASGERFDRFMRRAVLAPLGVPGGYHPADLPGKELRNVATLYRKREAEGQERWDATGPWIAQVDDYATRAPVPRADARYVVGTNGCVMSPQGGLRTSAAGLGRIMRMLMDRGTLDGKRIYRPETIDLMLKTQWHFDGKNGVSGYGNHADRFLEWGLGNQHFLDEGGPARGDRLVDGGGMKGFGHLGDAWGLTGVFAFDPATRNGLILLTGGIASDPEATVGKYSALFPHEERILTALYRRAVQQRDD